MTIDYEVHKNCISKTEDINGLHGWHEKYYNNMIEMKRVKIVLMRVPKKEYALKEHEMNIYNT